MSDNFLFPAQAIVGLPVNGSAASFPGAPHLLRRPQLRRPRA